MTPDKKPGEIVGLEMECAKAARGMLANGHQDLELPEITMLLVAEFSAEKGLPTSRVREIVAEVEREQNVTHVDAPPPAAHAKEEVTAAVQPWPEKPDEAIYHGVAGEIARTLATYSEAQAIAILVQLLVAVGNALQRTAYYQIGGTRHHTNLFVVLVGPTSKARKGTAWGHVRSLLTAIDEGWATENVVSGLSSGEGLIFAVRDPIEKTVPIKERGRVVDYQAVIEDPGVKDKRLLVIQEEFASVLRLMSRDGNILSPVIRQAWDTGTLRTLVKSSPTKSTNAHISIIGHITADELRRNLDKTDAGNGFANRFLFVCVRRAQLLPDGAPIPQEVFTSLVQKLREALAKARTIAHLERDDEAAGLWYGVYQGLSEGRPGLLGAVTSRAEAQVLRLSMLYALLDGERYILRPHLEAALALWEYAEASAAHVFGTCLGDPTADTILSALRAAEANGVSRTEIRDLMQRNASKEEVDRALRGLEAAALARCEMQPTKGRPREVWFAGTPTM